MLRPPVNLECVTQDLQQRAEAKVAGLEAQIAMLKDQISSLQARPALERASFAFWPGTLLLKSQCGLMLVRPVAH